MKKTKIISVFLCAALCGCNSAPQPTAEISGTSETTAASTITSVSVSEAETKAKSVSLTEKTTVAEIGAAVASAEKAPIKVINHDGIDTDSLVFFAEDALESEFSDFEYDFDYAYAFPATGVYDDSFRSPEKFDVENYFYDPEKEYKMPNEYIMITAGDTFGDAVIRSAQTTLMRNPENDEAALFVNSLVLDGEYEFTGIMYYYFFEEYGSSSGDLFFVPDESYEGFPLVCGFRAYSSFHAGAGAYSELARGLFAGNILNGGNSSMDIKLGDDVLRKLDMIFGNEKDNCAKKARVRLSDITLNWNDQIGTMLSSAVITDIEEIS